MAATLIGTGDGAFGTPCVAVNAKGKVHALFRGADARIYYARWNGKQWQLPAELLPSPVTTNHMPHLVAAPDGAPHAVFVGQTGPGAESYAVYYTVRQAGNWAVPEKLPTGTFAQLPRIAVGTDGVRHVVFNRLGQNLEDICYLRNDGSGWSKPLVLGTGAYPVIQLDASGVPYIAWGDQIHIRYTRPDINGTWSPPQVVKGGKQTQVPALALDAQGNLHIAWQVQTPASYGLMYARRGADGQIAGNQHIPPGPLQDCLYPQVTVDCMNRVRLVYQGRTSSQTPYDVYMSVLDEGTWSAPGRLDTPPLNGIHQVPNISANGNVLATIWWTRQDPAKFTYADVTALDCSGGTLGGDLATPARTRRKPGAGVAKHAPARRKATTPVAPKTRGSARGRANRVNTPRHVNKTTPR